MNSKTLAVGVIVVLVIAAGFIFLRNNGSQPAMTPTSPPQQTMSISPQSSAAAGSAVPANSASSSPTAAKNAVQIANFAFSPASLTVKAGDTVTWTNQDSAGHSATADGGTFDTGVLAQGKSGTVTFSKAGTYTYHCSIHPMMHGTIIVQ